MRPLKVLSVFGTRPEAIKMVPVILELMRRPGDFESRVCVTAQHRDMLDEVLSLFNIWPDYDLDIMCPNQSLSYVMAAVLTKLEPILAEERPDWLLVQGDTTTVLAATLAAFYQRIKVGHIEAGLRTGNKFHPYPEEINRVMTDHVCDLRFAPTEESRQNLLREGIPDRTILVTGNTVIDALRMIVRQPYDATGGPLDTLPPGRRLVLVTAHRRENFGEPIRNICQALRQLADVFVGDVHLIYPVHRNPNIQRPVYEMLSDHLGITLLDPVDYQTMAHLMNRAVLILSDSGGIQEEAAGLGKPVLVLRETTERPEGVEAGVLKVVGTDPEAIVQEASLLLTDAAAYERMARAVNPFGDGRASQRIANALLEFQS